MATIDWFAEAQNPKVRKMLDVIAKAEGVKHGYNTQFGNTKIDDLSAHPNQLVPFTQTDGKQNKSSAAGRYQFINPTWKDVSSKLGLKDFGPESQDAAAVYLMNEAGALDAVKNGDYSTAMEKLGGTWASLPSSEYAQPKLTEEQFIALLNEDQEPGLLEQAVNMVVPTAEAAPVDELTDMILPQDAKDQAQRNQKASDDPTQDFGNLDLEPLSDTQLENYVRRNTKRDGDSLSLIGEQSNDASVSAMLPRTLEAILGPRGAGELRSQNLNQTNPALAKSFQSMNGNLGGMLPMALGASMSNDVGARSMGRSMLPLAMQSMVPTDVGEGLVMPDGTYVTDEPLATGSAGGANGSGKGLPVSGNLRIADIVDTAKQMGNLASEMGPDYGGYGVQFLGDTAKKLNDQFGYDERFLGGMSDKQMNWWRNYQGFINQVRNQLYGSALTLTEARAFEKQVASVASRPGSLKESLKSQFRILIDSLKSRENLLKGSGYDVESINQEIGALQKQYDALLESAPDDSSKQKAAPAQKGDEDVDARVQFYLQQG